MLCEECHAIFSIHLDDQEKSRLNKCLISHLKGVISSISLAYHNAAPEMGIYVHLTVRYDTCYFLTHRQDIK